MSRSTLGVFGNAASTEPSVSADGRFVAFTSASSILVPGDTNGRPDVFLRDRLAGTTDRVSVSALGAEGNGASGHPTVSDDGRFVAFRSDASNIVADDTNGARDIFLRDRLLGDTQRLTVSASGVEADGPSDSPSLIAFHLPVEITVVEVAFASTATNLDAADTNGRTDVFVANRVAGLGATNESPIRRLTNGNGDSVDPELVHGPASVGCLPPGFRRRTVSFTSSASDLVEGDTNGRPDVFLKEYVDACASERPTIRVSVTSEGDQASGTSSQPSISEGAVAFRSDAPDLVQGDTNGASDVFVRDLQTGTTERISVTSRREQADGDSIEPAISDDGRMVAFTTSAAALGGRIASQIATHDRTLHATSIVSLAPNGERGDAGSNMAVPSGDGRYVFFASDAANLVTGDANASTDVFARDTAVPARTIAASVDAGGRQGSGQSAQPSVSANGRLVAFTSSAPDLVAGDTNGVPDVFVRDTLENTIIRASVATDGSEAGGASTSPTLSADGTSVSFASVAALDPAGLPGRENVYVRTLGTGRTTLASVAPGGSAADGPSGAPSISGDGRAVVFVSSATNLVEGDDNGLPDVFLRDLDMGTTTLLSRSPAGRPATGASYDPSISPDGRWVTFVSEAANLVDLPPDTNRAPDVFMEDLQTPGLRRISVGAGGNQANGPSWSPSVTGGGVVAFVSQAFNLVPADTNGVADVFLAVPDATAPVRISVGAGGVQADDASFEPSISDDGSAVAFVSSAGNLVSDDSNGQPDVFVRQLREIANGPMTGSAATTGTTVRVSVGVSGQQADARSFEPSVSSDARAVAFSSDARNLVARETNPGTDVFVHDRGTPGCTAYSYGRLDLNFDQSGGPIPTAFPVNVGRDNDREEGAISSQVEAIGEPASGDRAPLVQAVNCSTFVQAGQ